MVNFEGWSLWCCKCFLMCFLYNVFQVTSLFTISDTQTKSTSAQVQGGCTGQVSRNAIPCCHSMFPPECQNHSHPTNFYFLRLECSRSICLSTQRVYLHHESSPSTEKNTPSTEKVPGPSLSLQLRLLTFWWRSADIVQLIFSCRLINTDQHTPHHGRLPCLVVQRLLASCHLPI